MKKFTSGIITILVALLLTTGVMAAGNAIKYKGYPVINVILNGMKFSVSDVPAISLDGRTLVPLKASVEKMDGIVNWDEKSKTATILKPETSIFFVLLSDDEKTIEDVDSSIPIIDEGKKFYSEADISGLPKGTYVIKSKIEDAGGTVVTESEEITYTIEQDNGMYEQLFEWDSFKVLPEAYKYKLEMKDSSGVFKTVATKTMTYE